MQQKILIIDDHPAMVEGYKSILERNMTTQYEVLVAYDCETAHKIITTNRSEIDIILLDVIMPPNQRLEIQSGLDLAIIIRRERPNAKLIMLTSHVESFVLYSIIKTVRPEGLLVKSDFDAADFMCAYRTIVLGDSYYSTTVTNGIKEFLKHDIYLDSYNRQIITLLAQGIQTKNLPLHLNLSISAIDKRKAQIKDYFEIEKGSDEDIIAAAKKCGFI